MSRYSPRSESYLESYRRNKSCFGGSLLHGNPKGPRPFHAHQALHVVLRSSRATGKSSFLRQGRETRIKMIIRKQAARFGVRVYRLAVSTNHLHILLRPGRTRADFAGFLRAVSGLIARLVLLAEKGRKKGIKFWDKRPFSRIVAYGKPFARCAHYIMKNIFEALGFDGVEAAETELRTWRRYGWRQQGPPA